MYPKLLELGGCPILNTGIDAADINVAFTLHSFGTPNRPVRTFEELKAKYYEKLGDGFAVVGTAFSPTIAVNTDAKTILKQFEKDQARFVKRLNSYSEEQLDAYLIPHPLLGKLFVREILYFTIFHIAHHHRVVRCFL